MKTILAVLATLAICSSSFAVDKPGLDRRIEKLTSRFVALQQKSDKSVPAEVLKKAQALILLDRTKAGFIFAYEGGSGIAVVRDKNSGEWGPVAFYRANEGSIGFQIGGQQSFVVILMMNAEGERLLTDPSFEFGGEARGTAGDQSAGASTDMSNVERPILVYTDREGLFGGAALKGGALAPDEEANRVYYGEPVSVKAILFDKKVKPTEAAKKLGQTLSSAPK
jgi:SH3 domain-containing YSC84-like protein 1